ncbi:MAG: glycosyltransferase, partial [Bdellovibrionales bacterium]|nr:glycosyltransferase [Bdellovibrionales bacterium]NQZ18669.1 glycosyltransferase [Bdellovibrionales bacterium]
MKVYFDVTCLLPERLSGIGVYAKNTFLELNRKDSSVLPVYKKSRLFKKKFIDKHIGQKGMVFIESFLNFTSEKTILHGPDFTLLSNNKNLKKVVTVHDLAVFHEDFNDQGFKERGREQMNRLFNKLKPDHIMVPSEAVEQELHTQWAGWEDKVTVIPHGADHLKVSPLTDSATLSGVP